MNPNVHFLYDCLTENWRTTLHAPLAQIGLALVALACGALIGMERERREKSAGLRTMILVCLGSAAFTMAGFAFTSSTGDSGRVAAQIVTGIGFLGAGVILHPRGMVSGATTAASIWVTASVGMIAGAGYAGAALGLSLLVRLVLVIVLIYENRMFARVAPVTVTLDFDSSGGRTRVRLERILVDYPPAAIGAEWSAVAEAKERVTLRVRLPRHHFSELLDDLVSVPEVRAVQEHGGASAS